MVTDLNRPAQLSRFSRKVLILGAIGVWVLGLSADPLWRHGALASGGSDDDRRIVLRLGETTPYETPSSQLTLCLTETRVRGEDCQDCPNAAVVEVRRGDETALLQYSISGGMMASAREKARRKSAFGLDFIISGIRSRDVRMAIVESEP